MSLGYDQKLFASLIPRLIDWAYENGYEVTFGDAYRDPRVFGTFGDKLGYGAANSYHKRRLAIDLNLFKDGKYLMSTGEHKPLGEYWKSLHPKCTWGGDFKNPDGNHYSFGEGR